MGDYYRIHYYHFNCRCFERIAANWNVAEYDFNWTLYRFIQLVASRFHYDLGAQILIFSVGVIVMGYGVGIYISPNIGAGPRDSLMLVFVEKTGASVKKVRTTLEVIVAIVGWLFGGPIGIGTVLIALFLGQIAHYTLPQCRKFLLKIIGKKKKMLYSKSKFS